MTEEWIAAVTFGSLAMTEKTKEPPLAGVQQISSQTLRKGPVFILDKSYSGGDKYPLKPLKGAKKGIWLSPK